MGRSSVVLLALVLAIGGVEQASAARGRARSGGRRNRGKKGRCRLPGCQRCDDADPNKCSSCRVGFALTEESKCEACGFGCKDCPNAGPGKCDACKPSFTLDREGEKTCQRCAAHCLQCDDAGPGGCNECGSRRMLHIRLEVHGEVHECLPCDAGCKACTEDGGCSSCDAFYALHTGARLASRKAPSSHRYPPRQPESP